MGRTQSDDESLTVPVSIQTHSEPADKVGQFGQGQREELRRRIESGEISQEELDRIRQEFRQGSGQVGPGGGFRRGGFGTATDGQDRTVDSGRHSVEEPTPEPSN